MFSLRGSWSQWAPEMASNLPMNSFGVPALAGPVRLRERNRLNPGLQTRRGSWLRFTLERGSRLFLVVCFVSAPLRAMAADDGFAAIFDGKTLAGWHVSAKTGHS